jgi:hypothetical protein
MAPSLSGPDPVAVTSRGEQAGGASRAPCGAARQGRSTAGSARPQYPDVGEPGRHALRREPAGAVLAAEAARERQANLGIKVGQQANGGARAAGLATPARWADEVLATRQ